MTTTANNDLRTFVGSERFATVLADPPWRFANRTGKMAPEHKRLSQTLRNDDDDRGDLRTAGQVRSCATARICISGCRTLHLPWGLQAMQAWGFEYKTNLIWHEGAQGRWAGRTRRRLLFSAM